MRAVVLDAEGADSLVVHLEDPDGGNGELLLFVALARRGRVPGSTTRCAAGSPPPCAPRSPRVTSRTGWSTCPSYPQPDREGSRTSSSTTRRESPAWLRIRADRPGWQDDSMDHDAAGLPQLTSRLYAIKQMESAIRVLLDEALAPLDLRVRPYTALTVLAVKGGLSSAELARRAFMRAQSMQDVIRTLEARGLVERRAAERDRRVLLVAITDAGREVVRQGSLLTAPIEQLLVTGTDPDALAAFDAVVAHGRAALARAVQQSRPVPNRSALGR
jgi:DNA-binding MarR family transcriptional regulator